MGAADRIIKGAGENAVSGWLIALLKALRPKQWVKNGLVFLPFLFAVNQVWSLSNLAPVPSLLLQLVLLFLAFCAVSSAVYLLNDLLDREADRRHPKKRYRPIASGKVTAPTATALIVVLALGGLAVMATINPRLGGIGLLYIFINVVYCFGAKRIVLLDVILVASGYVIRADAGAVAVGVAPSPWLYAVTAAGALFIVLGRRYAEVRLAGDEAVQQRSVLSEYAGPFIGQLLNISATAALVSYTLYAVEAENLPPNHTMLLTVPFVAFGLFRYLYLLNTNHEAESPEQLISRDIPLLVSTLCWLGASVLVLILGSQ
jgi:4-hydroxybenzoate polyprenyltransferase